MPTLSAVAVGASRTCVCWRVQLTAHTAVLCVFTKRALILKAPRPFLPVPLSNTRTSTHPHAAQQAGHPHQLVQWHQLCAGHVVVEGCGAKQAHQQVSRGPLLTRLLLKGQGLAIVNPVCVAGGGVWW